MSLIQEALDKAAKVRTMPASEAPAPPKAVSPAVRESLDIEEKIVKRFSRPKFERVSVKSVAAGKAGKIILAAALGGGLALALFLFWSNRPKNTAPVMMAGVSSIPQMPQAARENAAKFVLSGITESGTEKLAVINNQVVGTGDRLKEKAFVKEIRETYVILDQGGREIRLSL